MAMTIQQQQNLLQYLGYYEGKVDGISGPMTEGAVAAFRQDNGNPHLGDELEEVLIGAVFHSRFKPSPLPEVDFWDTVKHFGRHEFACKCGGKYCDGYPVEPDKVLITVADRARAFFGKPIHVSSGVRCEQHNANVGGTKGSRHKSGKAMDFRVEGKTSPEVLSFVDQQPEIRFCYAIDGTYVHMDVY